jgi:hypothetical protein
MLTIQLYVLPSKIVIPEARVCEARYEPTKPAIWNPEA